MKKENIHIMTGQLYDGVLYGACYEINALLSIDLHTGEMNLVSTFPNAGYLTSALYRDSVVVNDKIYFIPDRANNIAVYNVSMNSFEIIQLPENEEGKTGYDAVLYGKNIYLIPFQLKYGIMVYDIERKIFECKNELNEKISVAMRGGLGQDVYRAIRIDDIAVLPMMNTEICLEINMRTDEIVLRRLEKERVKGVIPGNDQYWIFVENGEHIYICNRNNLQQLKNSVKQFFFPVLEVNQNLIMLDKEKRKLVIYNKNTIAELNIENANKIGIQIPRNVLFFREANVSGQKVLYSVNMNGIIVSEDDKTRFVKTYYRKDVEESLVRYIDLAMKQGCNTINENGVGLQEFLKYVYK